MKRRTLLAVAGAATLPSIAGCLDDDDPEGGSGGNETDTQANGTETLDDGTDTQTDDTDTPPDDSDTQDDGTDTQTDDSDTQTDDNEGSDDMGGQPLFADSFSATSQGGFLAIDEDVENRSEAHDTGFVLPDGEEVLTLDAEVAEGGRWESTVAEFPTIQIDDPIRTEISLELPEGLRGQITEDRMTATGEIRVVIEQLDEQFSFEIDATSDQSGNLEGETGFENEPMTTTLVDNEFTIEDRSGNLLIDGELGLPADDPETNWFEIELVLTGA